MEISFYFCRQIRFLSKSSYSFRPEGGASVHQCRVGLGGTLLIEVLKPMQNLQWQPFNWNRLIGNLSKRIGFHVLFYKVIALIFSLKKKKKDFEDHRSKRQVVDHNKRHWCSVRGYEWLTIKSRPLAQRKAISSACCKSDGNRHTAPAGKGFKNMEMSLKARKLADRTFQSSIKHWTLKGGRTSSAPAWVSSAEESRTGMSLMKRPNKCPHSKYMNDSWVFYCERAGKC